MMMLISEDADDVEAMEIVQYLIIED